LLQPIVIFITVPEEYNMNLPKIQFFISFSLHHSWYEEKKDATGNTNDENIASVLQVIFFFGNLHKLALPAVNCFFVWVG
jgi:hypothetical protein